MYKKIWLQEMTWAEVKDRIKENDIAIIPIGSTEQHGPALPLGTDTYVAIGIAEDVAKKTGAVISPPLWYGDSSHHMAFSGTISLKPGTIIELVKDVCESLFHHGFTKILIINGHRIANLPALDIAARAIKEKTGIFIAVIDPSHVTMDIVRKVRETEGNCHAGEVETSHMLCLKPELVHPNRAVREIPKLPKFMVLDPYSGVNKIDIKFDAKDEARMTKSGIMGDPTRATEEKGKLYHEAIVHLIVEFVKDIACAYDQ